MDFLVNHGIEVAHLSINTVLLLWALARRADKAVVGHFKDELKKEFMTQADGQRMERKLDAVLLRYRRMKHASQGRPAQGNGATL
jgi:hypothetical protein